MTPRPEATERFIRLVQDTEAALPLDEAMVLIAVHGSDVDVDRGLNQLDEVAVAATEARRGRVAGFDDLLDRLFVDLGFAGNRGEYGDPRNSFLPSVVERRLGIPISLSVLAMEVGRRVGVPLHGIGMPGHFLVGDPTTVDVYADPFNAGTRLDGNGCAARFHELHGDASFHPAFLEPVAPIAIVSRVLANLKASYRARRDRASLAWVIRLRAAVPGVPLDEHRELASVLAADGRFLDAADVLDDLGVLAASEGRDDLAEEATRGATRLRARTN